MKSIKRSLFLCSIIFIQLMLAGCTFKISDTELVGAFPQTNTISINTAEAINVHQTHGYASNVAVIAPDTDVSGGFNPLGIGTALLVDDTSKDTIVSYGGDTKIYPASMTKVMSGILIAEALESGTINMDSTVIVKDDIVLEPAATRLDLKAGDAITVRDLVYGYLIRSMNDCGIVLANLISGSEEAFVAAMNERAYMLGATHTHFVNCHGLHDENHYTTAYDLYLFFREFAAHELIHEIDSITQYVLVYENAKGESVELEFKSTNGFLLGAYDLPSKYQIGAWKSGTTKAAGSCLIMQVMYQEHDYYAVICKANDRDTLYDRMSALIQCIPDT